MISAADVLHARSKGYSTSVVMSPEFGSKRTPHLRSTVPNVQRHKAYFAIKALCKLMMIKGQSMQYYGAAAKKGADAEGRWLCRRKERLWPVLKRC